MSTTVLLLAAFLAACLVQLVGGGLLIWLRPSGFVVLPAGMLLSAVVLSAPRCRRPGDDVGPYVGIQV